MLFCLASCVFNHFYYVASYYIFGQAVQCLSFISQAALYFVEYIEKSCLHFIFTSLFQDSENHNFHGQYLLGMKYHYPPSVCYRFTLG